MVYKKIDWAVTMCSSEKLLILLLEQAYYSTSECSSAHNDSKRKFRPEA